MTRATQSSARMLDSLPVLAAVATGAALGAAGVVWWIGAPCAAAVGLLVTSLVPRSTRPKSTRPGEIEEGAIRAIAEASPDALLFFSDTGSIRYANSSARELFFDGATPTGSNFLRLVGDAPVSLREALLGQSDRLFTVTVDGQSETYHVSRRDFEVERELHTLLVVKHLTREVSRREVELLKRLVRIISHEVNNTLAPVSSLVHSARLIGKNPQHAAKLDKVLDTIEERSTHLATFLEGYATLARLPDPRCRDVEWPTLFEPLRTLYPDARWGAPPEHAGYFDPVQIEQVMVNLLKNATESGTRPGDVEFQAQADATGACELCVLDRGSGFGDEALEQALLPMYSTKERGSGMGLALCREIVQAHGGSIGLANRPEGGAAVTVRLPGRHTDPTSRLARSRLTLTRA